MSQRPEVLPRSYWGQQGTLRPRGSPVSSAVQARFTTSSHILARTIEGAEERSSDEDYCAGLPLSSPWNRGDWNAKWGACIRGSSGRISGLGVGSPAGAQPPPSPGRIRASRWRLCLRAEPELLARRDRQNHISCGNGRRDRCPRGHGSDYPPEIQPSGGVIRGGWRRLFRRFLVSGVRR